MSTSSKDAAKELRGFEASEQDEIHESHSDVPKEHADKVEYDGLADVEEMEPIEPNVDEESVSHTVQEASEQDEIHESHSDVPKEHDDEVENDGLAGVEEVEPIGTKVNEENVSHTVQEDDGIHSDHGDLKEQECVSETVEDKDSAEVTHAADDTKIN